MRIFAQSNKTAEHMKLRHLLITCMALACTFFSACHNAPKTNVEKIDDLKKQLESDAKTLKDLETTDFVTLHEDFMSCDSMLQYLRPEQLEETFQKLQLVQAYLEQFKETAPVMKADMDSTLRQLDRLKADAETQYLSDSLVAVYLDAETQFVVLTNNRISYFQERFANCRKDMKALKKNLK